MTRPRVEEGLERNYWAGGGEGQSSPESSRRTDLSKVPCAVPSVWHFTPFCDPKICMFRSQVFVKMGVLWKWRRDQVSHLSQHCTEEKSVREKREPQGKW